MITFCERYGMHATLTDEGKCIVCGADLKKEKPMEMKIDNKEVINRWIDKDEGVMCFETEDAIYKIPLEDIVKMGTVARFIKGTDEVKGGIQ